MAKKQFLQHEPMQLQPLSGGGTWCGSAIVKAAYEQAAGDLMVKGGGGSSGDELTSGDTKLDT